MPLITKLKPRLKHHIRKLPMLEKALRFLMAKGLQIIQFIYHWLALLGFDLRKTLSVMRGGGGWYFSDLLKIRKQLKQ